MGIINFILPMCPINPLLRIRQLPLNRRAPRRLITRLSHQNACPIGRAARQRSRAARGDAIQTDSVDQLHHQEMQPLIRLHRMQRDDVRMTESRDHLSLMLKPRELLRFQCRHRRQQLDRHTPLEQRVDCRIDNTHSAATNLPFKLPMTNAIATTE